MLNFEQHEENWTFATRKLDLFKMTYNVPKTVQKDQNWP